MNVETQELKLYFGEEELTLQDAFSLLSDSKAAQKFAVKEVAKRLFLEKEIKKNNIEITEEEKSQLVEDFNKANNLTTDELIENFYQSTKSSKEDLEHRLIYQQKLLKLRDSVVPPESVVELFTQTRVTREQVMFSIIRVKDKELANDICKQVNTEFKDFGELARQHSVGENASQGGLIGPMPLVAVHPSLGKVIINLRSGEITEPIPSDDDTFIIAQLHNYQRAYLNTQLAENIKSELFERWIESQLFGAEIKLDY